MSLTENNEKDNNKKKSEQALKSASWRLPDTQWLSDLFVSHKPTIVNQMTHFSSDSHFSSGQTIAVCWNAAQNAGAHK